MTKSKMSGNQLTKEEVNDRLSSRGIVLLGEYENSDTKARFQCSKEHTWEAKPTNVLHGGTGCPRCSRRKVSLTKEIVSDRLAARGIVMLDEYVHQTVKARFQCSEGHTWAARPNNVLSGKGCPKCGSISSANRKRLPANTVCDRLAEHSIILLGEYVGSQNKARFQCKKGHVWETTPNSVMGGRGCPHCYGKNLPLTKDIVNSRIADRGITLLGNYEGAHASTLFQCNESHTWEARPANILQGKNCPHCDGQFPLSKQIVNERITDRGLILLGEYKNNAKKTVFQCSEGHRWEAAPANVMAGTGCAVCAGNLPLTTEIVNGRIADRGLVLLDEYKNNTVKRRFQCSEGHVWETAPANVLSGRGCTVCAERTSDNDVFYLWIAGPQELVRLRDGEFLLKYGVTSERRKYLRINEVGWNWNVTPNVLAVVKTIGTAIWAERAATRIGQRLTPDYSHLDGWSEFRIVNETELAHFMAIAAEAAEYKIIWRNPVPYIKEYHLEQLKLDLQW